MHHQEGNCPSGKLLDGVSDTTEIEQRTLIVWVSKMMYHFSKSPQQTNAARSSHEPLRSCQVLDTRPCDHVIPQMVGLDKAI